MEFKEKVATLRASGINLILLLLKAGGKLSKSQIRMNTGHESETLRQQFMRLEQDGILQREENMYSLSKEFLEEYDAWRSKEYIASEEDMERFSKLDKKYWLIRPIVEQLIKSSNIFDLSFMMCSDFYDELGIAPHTAKKYLNILEENRFLKIVKRGRFKAFVLEDSLIKIWRDIEKW